MEFLKFSISIRKMTKNMIQISMPILLTFLTTVVFLYFQNNKHSKESVGLFMYNQFGQECRNILLCVSICKTVHLLSIIAGFYKFLIITCKTNFTPMFCGVIPMNATEALINIFLWQANVTLERKIQPLINGAIYTFRAFQVPLLALEICRVLKIFLCLHKYSLMDLKKSEGESKAKLNFTK